MELLKRREYQLNLTAFFRQGSKLGSGTAKIQVATRRDG